MNAVISVAIFIILAYFGVAMVKSYQQNKEEPDRLEDDMFPWDCPECGFHVQAGVTCIYCQTEKPKMG